VSESSEATPGVFVADLSELALPEDVNARIGDAIRRAVLLEIATLDLSPRLSSGFGMRRPPGSTDGIWIQPRPDMA